MRDACESQSSQQAAHSFILLWKIWKKTYTLTQVAFSNTFGFWLILKGSNNAT
uniref:Uncharacterized protein n=1 Tax=Arundo donax TaxID=35708 RepID=A0A0A9AUZ3_ARUDO